MTTPNLKPGKYYPAQSAFKTFEEWYAHVQTYNAVYEMQDKLVSVQQTLDKHTQDIKSNTSNIGRAAVTTNIGGITIKPSIPTAGQKLTYNATTGQVEWQ